MAVTASFTYIDESRETSTTTVNIPIVTPANFGDTVAAVNDLRAGIEAVTIGGYRSRSINLVDRTGVQTPTDPQAQREKKWVVIYEDIQEDLAAGVPNPSFGKFYSVELPCADISGALKRPASDEADLDAPGWVTFIAAFEAIAKSPNGGDVAVRRAYYAGRNL